MAVKSVNMHEGTFSPRLMHFSECCKTTLDIAVHGFTTQLEMLRGLERIRQEFDSFSERFESNVHHAWLDGKWK